MPAFGLGVWPEITSVQEGIERWSRRAGKNDRHRSVPKSYPPLNLWEDNTSPYVEAELRELELTDLYILVDGDSQLSIKGERKQPERVRGVWHRRERGHDKFSQAGELPQYVDSEKVTAELKHGVVTVCLPKSEKVKPRRIEVKSD